MSWREGDAAEGEEGAVDGKNERNDKTEMNKWRLRKDKKGGEINRGGVMESVCPPLFFSLFLSRFATLTCQFEGALLA